MAKTNGPSQWIPVGVRLPYHNEGVLVCFGTHITIAYWSHGEWTTEDGGNLKPEWVSHWMPMPAPPPVDERASIISDKRGKPAGMLDHSKPDNGNWVA